MKEGKKERKNCDIKLTVKSVIRILHAAKQKKKREKTKKRDNKDTS